MQRYGLDPWADADQATHAAGLHLRESYQRTGSWDTAISEYHGGRDRRQWGPRTRAYGQRVGSFGGR